MNIGKTLQLLRTNAGLGVDDLAYKLDMDAKDIDNIENGSRSVTSAEIEKICQAFEISVDDFLRGKVLPQQTEGSVVIPVDKLNSLLSEMKK